MKRFIDFAFGKPYEKGESFTHKYFRFTYWAAVVFYFITISQQLLIFIFNPSKDIIFVLFSIVLFPIIFRLIYRLVGYPHGIKREE
ncbi:hypothetical protein CIB95_11250 [Lottiidibacillus patelloidae]|uniref:Uncharacterized protein n=1 Tax=Lottiidibacillus patelloidae TaxID=2670334 RepID=A0A263BUD2_9BACI|nr:hypothetical protein [Lottiidibacillus patelloidae]OZM56786.1 hypothetical protein CIB95_11250 [Lottiidibacillus patelloidae]